MGGERLPFLELETGKSVTVSLEVRYHKLNLISDDVMPMATAIERILNKLRADGLHVVETEQAIVIGLRGPEGAGTE